MSEAAIFPVDPEFTCLNGAITCRQRYTDWMAHITGHPEFWAASKHSHHDAMGQLLSTWPDKVIEAIIASQSKGEGPVNICDLSLPSPESVLNNLSDEMKQQLSETLPRVLDELRQKYDGSPTRIIIDLLPGPVRRKIMDELEAAGWDVKYEDVLKPKRITRDYYFLVTRAS